MNKPELERELVAAATGRKIELTVDDIRKKGLIAALRKKIVNGKPNV